MTNEHGTIGGLDLARWAIVAAMIVAGVALFFLYAGKTRPVVEPSVQEAVR